MKVRGWEIAAFLYAFGVLFFFWKAESVREQGTTINDSVLWQALGWPYFLPKQLLGL